MVVFASGDDETFGGMPVDTLDVSSVPAKDLLLEAAIEVPYANGSIVRTGREFRVRRAPAEFELQLYMESVNVKSESFVEPRQCFFIRASRS